MRSRIFVAIFFLVFCMKFLESAKILSIFSIPSKSHYIYASAILKELASRGHEITSVNTYPQKLPVTNFHDVFIKENLNIIDHIVSEAQGGEREDAAEIMAINCAMAKVMCINIFENSDFKELLRNPKGKFDLIILEVIWNESLMGLGEHFNAPMIGVSTFGSVATIDEVVGNPAPNSIVPNLFFSFTSNMTFIQRFENFIANTRVYFVTRYYQYQQQQLYHKYLPNSQIPFDKATTSFSLLLLNQHHSIFYPRPFVPNVIEASGLHINSNPDTLPENLQKFLDNATEGVIYFSMGGNIKSKNFPEKRKNIFLNVFRKLKQKVLWKFEDVNMLNKPDNVFIITWAPQQSILNHPNVKVFITHGGLLSVTEAVYYGVPMLGIPMFFDQPRNIALARGKGIAILLYLPEITEENLEFSLNELLYNHKYQENAKAVSTQYRDQPMTAMENAIYWIEYVLRHKGAYHLRNAGTDLNIFQYYSVDVVGLLVAIVMIIIFVLIKVFMVIKLLTQKKPMKKTQTKSE